MKKHVGIVIAGVSTILPVSVTLYLLIKIFLVLDGIIGDIITSYTGKRLIGLGFIIIISLIYGIGLLSKNILGERIISFTHYVFRKIPIAKTIYDAVHQISDSFFSKKASSFKTPVLINYPNSHSKSIGFITNNNLKVNGDDKISIFMPTTPNPTSGFLMIVNREDVEFLNISVDEAMKMIISLGVISPSIINTK